MFCHQIQALYRVRVEVCTRFVAITNNHYNDTDSGDDNDDKKKSSDDDYDNYNSAQSTGTCGIMYVIHIL